MAASDAPSGFGATSRCGYTHRLLPGSLASTRTALSPAGELAVGLVHLIDHLPDLWALS
jgi:hypothetical protein